MVVVQWLNQAAEVLEEQEDDGSVPWSGWAGYLGRQVVTHTHTSITSSLAYPHKQGFPDSRRNA